MIRLLHDVRLWWLFSLAVLLLGTGWTWASRLPSSFVDVGRIPSPHVGRLRALPSTFIVDRKGTIREVIFGGPLSEATLRSKVDAPPRPRRSTGSSAWRSAPTTT
jgi:hypothetical protein